MNAMVSTQEIDKLLKCLGSHVEPTRSKDAARVLRRWLDDPLTEFPKGYREIVIKELQDYEG